MMEQDFCDDEEKRSTPPPASPSKPGQIQRNLTAVSQRYDRHGKGYLDSTELALRRMDSQNQGYLDTDKVYVLMESLQHEQLRSAELMEQMQRAQKKAVGFKKGLIAMACFAVLLALANIGTSFAAATLAKDTTVDESSSTSSAAPDLTTLDGVRVATTPKNVQFTLTPIETQGSDARRTRRLAELQQTTDAFCQTLPEGVVCTAQGEFYEEDIVEMLNELCPTRYGSLCLGGVPTLDLVCHGVTTEIHGGLHTPQAGPTPWTDPDLGIDYRVWPSLGQGFFGVQSTPVGIGQPFCDQVMDLVFFCPTDPANGFNGVPGACLGMELFTPTCTTVQGNVVTDYKLCGDPPSEATVTTAWYSTGSGSTPATSETTPTTGTDNTEASDNPFLGRNGV